MGGSIMVKTSIKNQEAKLKSLNQKIKAEKSKIDQRLGKQIISQAGLDYTNLTRETIKELAKEAADLLRTHQKPQQK
ncbi:hypothetical protein HMPREF0497_2947 [Lentilactobacillus buchneri ATCC 11577]|nr:hypothetical protein HMPREF0497_2947 [Lentilactobacillus buchneri ATCC 11577]